MYSSAGPIPTNVALAAVGTPARRMTSLAYALDDSSRAAAADGPNTPRPASRRRSASPAARGASRPVVGCGATARVLAVQNALVMTGLDPPLQLGGTQRIERMRAIERVQDLEDPIERTA